MYRIQIVYQPLSTHGENRRSQVPHEVCPLSGYALAIPTGQLPVSRTWWNSSRKRLMKRSRTATVWWHLANQIICWQRIPSENLRRWPWKLLKTFHFVGRTTQKPEETESSGREDAEDVESGHDGRCFLRLVIDDLIFTPNHSRFSVSSFQIKVKFPRSRNHPEKCNMRCDSISRACSVWRRTPTRARTTMA